MAKETMNMEQLPGSNLVYLPADDGSSGILLNVGLIRIVDEICEGHCRVCFSETHQFSLQGKGADQLIVLLGSRAILVDGSRSKSMSETP
jgi:hypothetical protein